MHATRSKWSSRTTAIGTAPSSTGMARVSSANSPGVSTRALQASSTLTSVSVSELLEAFRAGKSPNTLEAYRRDLDLFATWIQQGVLEWMMITPKGEANLAVLRWQESMRELAPATINRRVAAVRSLSKLASRVGLIPYEISVTGVKSRAPNVTGPSRDEFARLLDDARESPRDYLVLRLLHDLGLRRSEVVSLDVQDVCDDQLAVLGKGRAGKENLTLPHPTRRAIEAYLGDRTGGPLIVTRSGRRMNPDKLCDMLYRRSQRVLGRKVSPHKIRHLAITTAAEVTGGNMPRVQAFSRHADARTAMMYVDNWKDEQGAVAGLVAG